MSARGNQAAPSFVRVLKCWACGREFQQLGPGRRRLICDDPKCNARRAAYRRNSGAALDRMEG